MSPRRFHTASLLNVGPNPHKSPLPRRLTLERKQSPHLSARTRYHPPSHCSRTVARAGTQLDSFNLPTVAATRSPSNRDVVHFPPNTLTTRPSTSIVSPRRCACADFPESTSGRTPANVVSMSASPIPFTKNVLYASSKYSRSATLQAIGSSSV